MQKWIFTLFTLSIVLFATAQETKIEDPNAENRTIKPFHSVKVGDGIDLYLSQSTEESVVASASREEYRNRLKTEVEDGLLKIYYDRESFSDWTSSGKKSRRPCMCGGGTFFAKARTTICMPRSMRLPTSSIAR